MKFFARERLKQLGRLLVTDRPEPVEQAARIAAMQRDIVLPAKAGIVLVVLYFLFYSDWHFEAPTTRSVIQGLLQNYFIAYVVCNAVAAAVFYFWRRLKPGIFQWIAFTLGLLDGLFIAGLTIVTGGFDSVVFWIFPGLILLNAISIPLAMPQIVLNLTISLLYLGAGLLTPHLPQGETAIISVPGRSTPMLRDTNHLEHAGIQPVINPEAESPPKTHRPLWSDETAMEAPAEDPPAEVFILRGTVLWLLTLCCYGAQVLWERQRRAIEEAAEFAARESQLHSAGRLAAEFAHQIKNPLAIVNNAAYSLRRSLQNQKLAAAAQQIEIIQEEVARADRVITQIMGYAQLSEGRVEKLDVEKKIREAVDQVFPAAVPTGIRVEKKFHGPFPPLFMQRGHILEILINLLLNAREALGKKGKVIVAASAQPDYAVEISVADDGPGIPPDKLEQVFEAYFTTKEKGTGLGLAIVKHNVELYGGTVRVDSALGKGAKFTVIFPAKAVPKPPAK